MSRDRQARTGRLRTAVGGGGRGRDLYQPHPRGRDGGERPGAVVRVGQLAQGRCAERGPDRRMPDQPQADQRQEKGGVREGGSRNCDERRAVAVSAQSLAEARREAYYSTADG